MDTMAIDSAQVPAMQAAIETYTVEVENHLNNIKSDQLDNSSGFYGSAQLAKINDYIRQTCDEINKIVRYFDEFNLKLKEVADAYVDQTGVITTGEVAAAKENSDDLVTINRMS